MTFALKPGPESGLNCLVCAIFARQRMRSSTFGARQLVFCFCFRVGWPTAVAQMRPGNSPNENSPKVDYGYLCQICTRNTPKVNSLKRPRVISQAPPGQMAPMRPGMPPPQASTRIPHPASRIPNPESRNPNPQSPIPNPGTRIPITDNR